MSGSMWRFGVVVLYAVISEAANASDTNQRPWVPFDSAATRYFSISQEYPERWIGIDSDDPVVYSPQSRHVFVLSHRGDVLSDANEYELEIFAIDNIREVGRDLNAARSTTIRPIRAVVLRSKSPDRPAISNARWRPDGLAVHFLGMTSIGVVQAFELDIESGALKQLTRHSRSIEWFEYRDGGVLFQSSVDTPLRTARYPMEALVRDQFGAVRSPSSRSMPTTVVYASYHEGVAHPLDRLIGSDEVWIAPGGRQAIAVELVTTGYRFILIDLTSGQSSRIEDIPPSEVVGGHRSVTWTPDATHAFLHSSAGVTRVTVATGYRTATRRVSDQPDHLGKTQVLRREVLVTLRQDANEPPRVVATVGNQDISLTSPDTALSGVWIAKQAPYMWLESGKEVGTGGLTLPRNWSRAAPPPLVIQVYYYTPTYFLPDGPHPTSDATQALAAKGFAVLQIDHFSVDPLDQEGPGFVRRIEAAVESLARDGLIDPTRVGLTGFSRGGYQTLFAITHPSRVSLGAVVCADSWTGSYGSYLSTFGAKTGVVKDWKSIVNGQFAGGDYWNNKAFWLEYESTFNTDRVRTPALFTYNGHGRPVEERVYFTHMLETVGAFRLNGKPIDVLNFPEGAHNLQRPRERIAMMQSVVDWMAFWLQADIDPDPAKSPQYARWLPLLYEQYVSLQTSPRT